MNKKCLETLTFTILLIFSIVTISYNTSHSKYIKEDNEALKYSVSFKNMRGDSLISNNYGVLSSSTYEYVKFYFTFSRSENMLNNDTKDTYEIVPRSNCSITKITADNATIDGNYVSFNSVGDETIRVDLKCNVERIIKNDKLNISMTVYENFNDSDKKYLYTDGTVTIPSSTYYTDYPKPASTDIISDDYKTFIMPSDRKNKIGGFNTWLSLFANEYSVVTYDEIYTYITNVFTDKFIDETNIGIINSIEGISATIDGEGNYVFTIDNRFTSLVKTYHDVIIYKLYFFESGYDINELFFYYIDKYNIYEKDSEQYLAVVNYINDNLQEGEDIISLSNRLNIGLNYDSETSCLNGVKNIYNYIMPIKLKYKKSNIAPRKFATLKTNLNATILSGTELIEKIDDSNTKIFDLLNIIDVNTMFDSYIYLKADKTILLHIYSNDTEYTYVDISFIEEMPIIMLYSVVDTAQIKSDLDYISTTIYNESLTLIDDDAEIITKYETLEEGTYNLNIGQIIVSNNKKIELNLKDLTDIEIEEQQDLINNEIVEEQQESINIETEKEENLET